MRTSGPVREQRVLAALIKLYIERREPISSRLIEESAGLDIKSASIRSVLGELEQKGYLHQPHASAGRIPTDAGYRAYVNQLLPTGLPDHESQEIDRALTAAGEDLGAILKATARLLGHFSENIAIMAGPVEHAGDDDITSIELYDRGGGRILLVVSLRRGAVRTEIVDLGRDVRPGILVGASAYLAERLTGRGLSETRRDLERMLGAATNETTEVASDVVTQGRNVFGPDEVLQITFDGVSEALDQPEFADPERLKALLQLITRHERFERALEGFVQGDAGEVSLAIGSENPVAELHPFTIMATRFQLGAASGYLGVLGPRRMRYARTIALIHGIAAHLERLH